MVHKKPPKRVSRRKFLKGATVVAPGMVAANSFGNWQQ
ncbi:MAG: twin-arginine translocation signal domain-containing protein [Acidobacteriota bacterium]